VQKERPFDLIYYGWTTLGSFFAALNIRLYWRNKKEIAGLKNEIIGLKNIIQAQVDYIKELENDRVKSNRGRHN
jgi:hypothetical protein